MVCEKRTGRVVAAFEIVLARISIIIFGAGTRAFATIGNTGAVLTTQIVVTACRMIAGVAIPARVAGAAVVEAN